MAEINIRESFGRFRNDFKLTKAAVARALGIQPTSYKYEEEGESANPTAKSLFKLAMAFNVSIDYLVGLTDDPTPRWKVDAQALSADAPSPATDDSQDLASIAAKDPVLTEYHAALREVLKAKGIEI